MSARPTTYIGIAAISLAIVGALMTSLSASLRPSQVLAQEVALSLAVKAALLVTGVLLVAGRRLALPSLVCTLLLSVAHSVLVYAILLPPISAGLSPAAHAGRALGRATGLVMGPLMYVALTCYLVWLRGRPQPGPGDYLGRRLLVGITYESHDGTFLRQEQFHGTIVEAGERGIVIERADTGARVSLPPQVQRAGPGSYRLRSNGEVVVDPDYLAQWVMREPAPARDDPAM